MLVAEVHLRPQPTYTFQADLEAAYARLLLVRELFLV